MDYYVDINRVVHQTKKKKKKKKKKKNTIQSMFSQFCNLKFPSISHTSGLNAKIWNLNNTVSMREKNSRKCYQAHKFMVQTQ